MTAKNRLTRLEAAQRRRPVVVKPPFDWDALTEDEMRLVIRLQEKSSQGTDLSALTADEAAAADVIYKKVRLK